MEVETEAGVIVVERLVFPPHPGTHPAPEVPQRAQPVRRMEGARGVFIAKECACRRERRCEEIAGEVGESRREDWRRWVRRRREEEGGIVS